MHLLPARLLLWTAGMHGEYPLHLGLLPQGLCCPARTKDASAACTSPPADCWDACRPGHFLAMHGEHPLSLGLQPWSLCCPAARLVVAKRTGLDIGPAADARLPGGGQRRRQPGGHRGDQSRLIRQTNSPPAAARGSCCRLTAPESTHMPRRGVTPTSARAIAVTIAGAIAAAIASVSASAIASAGKGASASVSASGIASASSPVRASDSTATARRQQGAAEQGSMHRVPAGNSPNAGQAGADMTDGPLEARGG